MWSTLTIDVVNELGRRYTKLGLQEEKTEHTINTKRI